MSALDFLPVSPGPVPGPARPAPARSSTSASNSGPASSSRAGAFDALVNEKAQTSTHGTAPHDEQGSEKSGKKEGGKKASEKDQDADGAVVAAAPQPQDDSQPNATDAIARNALLAFLLPIQQQPVQTTNGESAEQPGNSDAAGNTEVAAAGSAQVGTVPADPKAVGIRLDPSFEVYAAAAAPQQGTPENSNGAAIASAKTETGGTPTNAPQGQQTADAAAATDVLASAAAAVAPAAAQSGPTTNVDTTPKPVGDRLSPTGPTRGIADAARRQAWSDLARALDEKRAATDATSTAAGAARATADVALRGVDGLASGAGQSGGAHGSGAIGSPARAQGAASDAALRGVAGLASGAGQAAGGANASGATNFAAGAAGAAADVALRGVAGLASGAGQSGGVNGSGAATGAGAASGAGAHANGGAANGADAAGFAGGNLFGADSGGSFDGGAQGNFGGSSGMGRERTDTFASYAAALGRGAGDSGSATTTTGFPLHQVTSIVTTHTDTSPLGASSAAAAAGSGTASALPAHVLAQIADPDAAQQVIRSMRMQWNGSVGEAQLRLQPEHLGQVLVSVRVEQGTVSATLQADSASAQQWIQAHQQELRQALQDQGLRVTDFNVTTNPDDRSRRDASQQEQPREQQQSNSNTRTRNDRQTSDGRTFEIRV